MMHSLAGLGEDLFDVTHEMIAETEMLLKGVFHSSLEADISAPVLKNV